MRIVTFERPDGHLATGVLRGEDVLDFSRALAMFVAAEGLPTTPAYMGIGDLLEHGLFAPEMFADVMAFVATHGLQQRLTVSGARLVVPFIPNRIIALGRNYAAHAAETGHKPPKEPVYFIKASTSVVGPGEPVVIPRKVGRVDHEVELAVVIGGYGRRISRARAMEYVAGYTILNDVTARDMQTRDMALSHPWFLSKSMDTFGPFGPCITLPDEIGEPVELDLSLRVNGEVRQSSNTRDLIFKIPELIHRLSRYVTLEPGDVISTGTPEGISPIQPGDTMEARIDRIGVLRNPVVAGR